jgi:hypothetical protein
VLPSIHAAQLEHETAPLPVPPRTMCMSRTSHSAIGDLQYTVQYDSCNSTISKIMALCLLASFNQWLLHLHHHGIENLVTHLTLENLVTHLTIPSSVSWWWREQPANLIQSKSTPFFITFFTYNSTDSKPELNWSEKVSYTGCGTECECKDAQKVGIIIRFRRIWSGDIKSASEKCWLHTAFCAHHA